MLASGMDYQFKTLGKKCATTGTDLAPGSRCYSVLIEDDGELTRLDYSEVGWKGPPPKTVGTWRSIVPKPAEPKRMPLDTNALVNCFEQLQEEADPAREKLRYILALLLIQKRRLHLDGSRQVGADEYLQLSSTQGEGAWEVRDLQLSEEEMHDLQRELTEFLDSGWATQTTE